MVKKLFVAASGQNVGKTTFSLGLIQALQKKKMKVGFIKPMGQRYILVDGISVDEDSVLIKKVCGLEQSLRDLSPVAMENGYSEKYILKPHKMNIEKKIKKSFANVSKGKDIVVIEGTGHGGVGSVFDFSNAQMAKLLSAPVLLVVDGGLGSTIDRITLNRAVYEQLNVKILGVVVNKIKEEKYEKIKRILPIGLKHKKIKDYGMLPYRKVLSSPSMEQIKESLDAKVLNIGHGLHCCVSKLVVGAMAAHNALTHFTRNVVIITPGDRDDIMLAAMSKYFTKKQEKCETISGVVVTGGLIPRDTILELAQKTGVPIILSPFDTYKTALKIQKLIIKIMPEDANKITEIRNIIQKYGKINQLLEDI